MKREVMVRKTRAKMETRIVIMEAAERLFGEHGIESVALRTISKAAGQKNTNSVQYHFGNRMGLLRAIFEYREGSLDVMRARLLEDAREHGHLSDVRWLLRVIFYPEFCHYADNAGLPFIRLHAQYLSNMRPRGIEHPVDYECESTKAYREAIALLHQKLNFLSREQFMMRLESVGAMFLGALMQHAARIEKEQEHSPTLFAILLEMMAAAITVPPWDFSQMSG